MITASVVRPRGLAYVALMKPRIIELLLITTVPAMVVAQGGMPSIRLVVLTLIGGTLSAGGANAFNMYLDRDIDSVMERTARRPLVTGEVKPDEALAFAFMVTLAAFLLLAWGVNPLAAIITTVANGFYVLVYTLWLKRSTPQNIVIGGAAGAAPALVGWVAVTGSLALEPWLMFAIVFFWTPPHFWALAIKYSDDYKTAQVPMMPVVEGFRSTAFSMLTYASAVWVTSLALWAVSDLGFVYLVCALILGWLFCVKAWRLYKEEDPTKLEKAAVAYFTFSITHLSILFCVMAVDVFIGWGT